ncbi:hypothetical protein, partial [Salmonella sp. s51090]|uniref:hypothetical protein n=1 Tax=Salmonella sp. s51090 TaxID=3159651 RepID=UPI0039813F38
NHGLQNYENRSDDSHSSYHASDRDEDSRRMDHLMHVMSQSPYLQQGLPRQQFIRPFVITGEEERHRELARADTNRRGQVARNPLASMY